MTREEIINLLDEELQHAKDKHGPVFADVADAFGALYGEMTEVLQAIPRGDMDGEHGLKQELIDVMAVCFKALEGLE